jgi:hypothetical protein
MQIKHQAKYVAHINGRRVVGNEKLQILCEIPTECHPLATGRQLAPVAGLAFEEIRGAEKGALGEVGGHDLQ